MIDGLRGIYVQLGPKVLTANIARPQISQQVLIDRNLPPYAFIDNTDLSRAVCASKVLVALRGCDGLREVITSYTAQALNSKAGVTAAQREAMHIGALFGWDASLSYPGHALYENLAEQDVFS